MSHKWVYQLHAVAFDVKIISISTGCDYSDFSFCAKIVVRCRQTGNIVGFGMFSDEKNVKMHDFAPKKKTSFN
jgi:hypothetical protein